MRCARERERERGGGGGGGEECLKIYVLQSNPLPQVSEIVSDTILCLKCTIFRKKKKQIYYLFLSNSVLACVCTCVCLCVSVLVNTRACV